MKPLCSIFIHRLVFVLISSVFIYNVYDLICFEYHEWTTPKKEPPKFLLWSDVNIEDPPLLNNSRLERMRLNELFAVPQYSCEKPRTIGNKSDSFVVCEELGELGPALVITGATDSLGAFESQLDVSKWTVFLPEGNNLIDTLQGDVEVNYMTELKYWRDWHTWDFEQAVKSETYGTAKINLYTKHFKSFDQPAVIRKIFPLMKSTHLMLYVYVGNEDSYSTVIGEWYRLFYWLIYQHGYAIVAANPAGSCGNPPATCRYRVSLARTGIMRMHTAPVFGIGSPTEEKKRLVRYITSNSSGCNLADKEKFPKFCTDGLGTKSKVIIISYGESLELPRQLDSIEQLHLISPTQKKTSGDFFMEIRHRNRKLQHVDNRIVEIGKTGFSSWDHLKKISN